jgi:hypothetical protein
MPLQKNLKHTAWPWSSTCPNLFIVPWASVCHVVGLGKHSGLNWIWFKMDDSVSTVLKHIKQQADTEFFMPKNETPNKIHQNYWIYMVKILWTKILWHFWERKSRDSGRYMDLNDHLWSGRPLVKNRWTYSRKSKKKLGNGWATVDDITVGLG